MLGIVPARGGSKGVARKNLRNVAGKPLILWTLDTLAQVPHLHRVVVSTEDAEIAGVVRAHGYEVVDRPPRLAQDDTTIAEVAEYTTQLLGWTREVGVFQPTSPTLSALTIKKAIDTFVHGRFASLGSVVGDTKLRWDEHGPLFSSRVNRQQLDPEWRETGGIQLARACPVGPMDPLVGHPHHLFEIPLNEAHDIDTPDDLEAARRALSTRRVEFRLVASERLGAGHLFRCLALAEELSHHQVRLSVPSDEWVQEAVRARGFERGRWDRPDLVVFDTLDTSVEEVAFAKARGARVVTLEDLGPGSQVADLTVNELYADGGTRAVSGPKWAVLRPEFLGLSPVPVGAGERVLVAFGGTDPAHLAERVSAACALEAKEVSVLVGPGSAPRGFAAGVNVVRGNVAELVRQHDLVVTSAGRMVHEVAACGVPVVSIAANERESRHSHCAGVLRLGLHAALSDEQIRESVRRLLGDRGLRAEMAATAQAQIDGLGARRIAHRAEALLEGL